MRTKMLEILKVSFFVKTACLDRSSMQLVQQEIGLKFFTKYLLISMQRTQHRLPNNATRLQISVKLRDIAIEK